MKRAWLFVVLFTALVTSGVALAQGGAGGGSGGSTSAEISSEDASRIQRVALDHLVRFALDWVRSPNDPKASDYKATASAMRVILRYAPKDVELLRLRIAALRAAGELDEVQSATKQLIRLRPDDTVAQLRVLMWSIHNRQDAASRMAMYDRLLGPRGAGLDISIRSRLAFDAALLAREMGEEGVYRDRLLLAAEDRTNKEAAALFSTEFLGRAQSGMERVELLANVVLSDPVDAGALENLAGELMRRGAFRGAQRMWDRVSDVLVNSGDGMSSQQLFEYDLGLWALEGAEATLAPIDVVYNAQVMALEMEQARMKEEGISFDEDKEYVLPQIMETIRLAVYLSQEWAVEVANVEEDGAEEEADAEREGAADEDKEDGAQEEVKNSRAQASLDRIEVALDDIYRSREAGGDDEEMLVDLRAAVSLEMNATRLWSGLELDEAEAAVEELEGFAADDVIDAEAVDRFRGMLAAQHGDLEAAERLLGAIGASDDTFARYGLCIAEERGGSLELAIEKYRSLALDAPETLLGGLARERVEWLGGGEVDYGEDARAIDDYMMDFAPWLDRLTASPRNFIELRVESPRTSLGPLERMEVELTLKNVSRWPLAVGPGKPIHTRILLVPSLRVGGKDIRLRDDGTLVAEALEVVQPVVVELDRRIRLLPGESIVERVWVGKGGVGRLLDRTVSLGATVRWRAVQGFVALPDGGYEKGANCITTAGDVIRRASAPKVIDEEDLAFRFKEATVAELMVVLMQARGWLVDIALDPDMDDLDVNTTAGGMALAIEGRYEDMDDSLKSLVVSFLAPYGFFNNEGANGIMERLLDEESDLVRLAVLSSYGTHVPDEYVREIAEGDDKELAEIARLVVERVGLEEEEETLGDDSAAAAAVEAMFGGGEDESGEEGGGGL